MLYVLSYRKHVSGLHWPFFSCDSIREDTLCISPNYEIKLYIHYFLIQYINMIGTVGIVGLQSLLTICIRIALGLQIVIRS